MQAHAPDVPAESTQLTIQDLPEAVLARIFDFLDAPGVSAAEWTCKRFRSLVWENGLWRDLCYKASAHCARIAVDVTTWDRKDGGSQAAEVQYGPQAPAAQKQRELDFLASADRTQTAISMQHPDLSGTFPGEAGSNAQARSARSVKIELDQEPGLKSWAFRRLHAQLTAPWETYSVLLQAIAASSTDNIEENASNVLTTLHRLNPMLGVRTRAYWSSKGSRDEHSSEWLLLCLVHPLCLVQSVAIRPFRATFQWGHPLYSAKAVRFTFSCGRGRMKPVRLEEPFVQWDDLWDKGDQCTQGFQTTSETFPMQQRDELQVFTFKEPILCVGGLFKIELLGRVQKQQQDDAWYTCINYVSVCGKPLYGFTPAQPSQAPAHEQKERRLLLGKVADPLVENGGLMKLSEGGSLEERLAVEAEGGNVTESDEEVDIPEFIGQIMDGGLVDLGAQALVDLGFPMQGPPPVGPQ